MPCSASAWRSACPKVSPSACWPAQAPGRAPAAARSARRPGSCPLQRRRAWPSLITSTPRRAARRPHPSVRRPAWSASSPHGAGWAAAGRSLRRAGAHRLVPPSARPARRRRSRAAFGVLAQHAPGLTQRAGRPLSTPPAHSPPAFAAGRSSRVVARQPQRVRRRSSASPFPISTLRRAARLYHRPPGL